MRPGSRPGANYVRIARHKAFRTVDGGNLLPERDAGEPKAGLGKVMLNLKRRARWRPARQRRRAGRADGKFKGLAIFASDNISSSAYASEEIMRVLVLAGTGALWLTCR